MKQNKPTTENTESTEIKEKRLNSEKSSVSVPQCIQWLNILMI
jgi:hypothetical protein